MRGASCHGHATQWLSWPASVACPVVPSSSDETDGWYTNEKDDARVPKTVFVRVHLCKVRARGAARRQLGCTGEIVSEAMTNGLFCSFLAVAHPSGQTEVIIAFFFLPQVVKKCNGAATVIVVRRW